MESYDLIVIGAGPGGYVAAIRAAQLGLKTACVDRWLAPDGQPVLGGTCLNVGCIPSKTLLDTSHHYHNLTHLLPGHGITVKKPHIDIDAMQARRAKVIRTMNKGIVGLFKKNNVRWLAGHAKLIGDNQVQINSRKDSNKEVIIAKNIIIASGSVPVETSSARVDGTQIVNSEGGLLFSEVPKRLGIIGAGVIGLEIGSVWNRLGSEVVLIEAMDTFLNSSDPTISKASFREFKKQGLDIRLGTKLTSTEKTEAGIKVSYHTKLDKGSINVDKLIVAIGRRAFTDGLGTEAAGLQLDERGHIIVDEHCRTNVPNIYAIGDATTGPMLAHKASEEGTVVAEKIAGQASHIDRNCIPWVIYTHPEIAWVGRTEPQLIAEGLQYRTGSFPYGGNGRAQGAGETQGVVKILGCSKTDRLLGVHIFGAQASELIGEAVVTMAFGGATEDLARIIHAHPTLSEVIHEAALSVDDRAIHL